MKHNSAGKNRSPAPGPGGASGTARRWCRFPQVPAGRSVCTIQPRSIPSAGARTGPWRCVVWSLRIGRRRPNRHPCHGGTGPWPSPGLCLHNRDTRFFPVPARPCRTGGRADVRPALVPPCDTAPGHTRDAGPGPSPVGRRPSAARFVPVPDSDPFLRTQGSSPGRARGRPFRT